MAKKESLTSKIVKKDLPGFRNSLKNNCAHNVNEAKKSVVKLELTDKEKLESGDFEWVDVTPKYGKTYRALKRKTNG